MENIVEKINYIIECSSNTEHPVCKNCGSYCNNACTFKQVNEKRKITTPNYSCGNFHSTYAYNNKTIEALKCLLEDMQRVNEGTKNLALLLEGKITEQDFTDLIG